MNPRMRFEFLSQPRRVISIRFLLVCCVLIISFSSLAQQAATKRKLVNHAAAPYPALARTMALSGLVKLDALVAQDGSVKTVDIKGGHPVLAQAAANTIRQWKWEPAPHESHELVEIRFSPPE